MIKIGITGGIGSGKTFVAKQFASPIFNADREVKKIYKSTIFTKKICKAFKLKNKIVSTNETISINGKKIKNCIKVSGYGKTSYYPDPTLGNINIEIFVI